MGTWLAASSLCKYAGEFGLIIMSLRVINATNYTTLLVACLLCHGHMSGEQKQAEIAHGMTLCHPY
jgi:hypothetical protein